MKLCKIVAGDAYTCEDEKTSPAPRSSCSPSSPASSPSPLWSYGVDSKAARCLFALRLQQDNEIRHHDGVETQDTSPFSTASFLVPHHVQDLRSPRSSCRFSTKPGCSSPPRLVLSNECSCDISLTTSGSSHRSPRLASDPTEQPVDRGMLSCGNIRQLVK